MDLRVPLTDKEKELAALVCDRMKAAEDTHKHHRSRWNHLYALYRSYSDFRSQYQDASPPDKDEGLRAAKREWGAELFIPYSFSVVETIVPRMLSNRPRMLIMPRGSTPEHNVERMRMLIDAQQEQIQYELILQDVAKAGQIYGLGVQKLYWRKEYRRNVRRLVPSQYDQGQMVEQVIPEVCVFDDWTAQAVDPFHFFWDVHADGMDNCKWVVHRTYRDLDYIMDMVRRGRWRPLDEEEVRRMSPGSKWDELLKERQQAEGITSSPKQGEHHHEVLEFHDGQRMITVLDRTVPVVVADNPAWHGEIPFQVYRPTKVPHRMVGVGAIEPMEHLQEEMNTLRSQRRDAATMKLNAPLAYYDGLVEQEDIQWGPNVAIPVNGDPSELIRQLQVGDIPSSGYQEEANLQADIERTTGISDLVSGRSATGTATGAQLEMAAANVRIQQMTRRMEVEVIARAGRQALALNQQKITEPRVITAPSLNPNEGRYRKIPVSPPELMGEMVITPEGGATAPDNVPQKRQDAQMKLQLLSQNPQIDQRLLLQDVLRDMGYRQPESMMAPPEPSLQEVLPVIAEMLKRAGADEQKIGPMLQQAVQIAQQQRPPQQLSEGQAV